MAERFYAAVAAKEGERACAQLTPGLALFFFCLFLAALALQSLTGWQDFNNDQYVGTADFWERTLQNWQSEFLAVGSMAIFAVYLRQRGSPESKPVGAAHDATGTTG